MKKLNELVKFILSLLIVTCVGVALCALTLLVPIGETEAIEQATTIDGYAPEMLNSCGAVKLTANLSDEGSYAAAVGTTVADSSNSDEISYMWLIALLTAVLVFEAIFSCIYWIRRATKVKMGSRNYALALPATATLALIFGFKIFAIVTSISLFTITWICCIKEINSLTKCERKITALRAPLKTGREEVAKGIKVNEDAKGCASGENTINYTVEHEDYIPCAGREGMCTYYDNNSKRQFIDSVDAETGLATVVEYNRSFAAKLLQLPFRFKRYYQLLKNRLERLSKSKSFVGRNNESISCGKYTISKFATDACVCK
jgi:hypothetical protein